MICLKAHEVCFLGVNLCILSQALMVIHGHSWSGILILIFYVDDNKQFSRANPQNQLKMPSRSRLF